MYDFLRRQYNRIRLFLKRVFVGNVKRVIITDEAGKQHDVTIEKQKQKTCPHTRLEQLHATIWKCQDCDHAYFEITYKVILSRIDLLGLFEKLAKHFGAKIEDEEVENQNQNENDNKPAGQN